MSIKPEPRAVWVLAIKPKSIMNCGDCEYLRGNEARDCRIFGQLAERNQRHLECHRICDFVATECEEPA